MHTQDPLTHQPVEAQDGDFISDSHAIHGHSHQHRVRKTQRWPIQVGMLAVCRQLHNVADTPCWARLLVFTMSAPEHSEGLVDLSDIRWKMLVACDICRRRKVRCDGQRPCVRCSKGGKECTFSTP